ncbi:MAG TPA: formate dehydrogenase accessory sulfurtransferase FdhD [Streptosporangiaceae bacterium]|nr:formate dehydrogenase accessory sulfurtransferase FdhD [Streptosporangiaceae bacterium]
MTGRTARRRVLRISLPGHAGQPGTGQAGAPETAARADLLAAEEPLGIRVGGQALTLTMRTPGDDIDLAAGFLVSEGIVQSAADIASIRICAGQRCGHADHDGGQIDGAQGDLAGNIADVELRPGLAVSPALRRNFLTTSSCGVCGKASIRELSVLPSWDLNADQALVSPAVLAALPAALRAAQRVFARTGGLHAAGVFRADGELLAAREDVGRHNAVDKVVGWALRAGRLPLSGCVLLVSGRASFELVQKAALAGTGPEVAAGRGGHRCCKRVARPPA